MVFKCTIGNEHWKGKIKRFVDYGNYYEVFIESRSSIYILFGKTSRGGFVCAPDYNVGCHMVNLKDKFWNTEMLVSILGKVDGTTAASALFFLSNKFPAFNC
jgi:hypothetical protein